MWQAILVFPVNVLLVFPAIVLYFSDFETTGPLSWRFVAASILFIPALVVMVWTVVLFKKIGRGTPAPWNPPARLVVAGPYRHVRNPMLGGVFATLAAEALFFQSHALWIYFVVFLAANFVYFPLFEEKALLKRFGRDYEEYRRNVPRYLPRLTPWSGTADE